MASVNAARDEMDRAHRRDQHRKRHMSAVRELLLSLLTDESLVLSPSTREKAQAAADELWEEILHIDRVWS